MEYILPYNLDLKSRPFQSEILRDERRFKVLVIPRRHGKTTLAIAKLVMEAIINPRKVFHYVCPTQRQAKQIVWSAPDMLKQLVPPAAVDRFNEVELICYLKNGSQIHVKGADNPDSLRGSNAYGTVLDEFDQMKAEVFQEIYLPIVLANGGWLWVMGTPKGKKGLFEKLAIAKNRPVDWHYMLIQASKAGILSKEVLDIARSEMTEAAYNQEFECNFLDNAGTLFRRIKENVKGTISEPVMGRQYVIGVDLAKYEDWTVLIVLDRTSHEIVYFDRFNKIDWNLQKSKIEALARRYNNAKCRIDATGVGDPVVEDLIRTGITVEPFKITSITKKQIVENLVLLLEQDKIKLPDIPELIDELESFSYELNERTGHVMYCAPSGKHDDIVIALCLAVWQLGEKLYKAEVKKFNYKFSYDKFGSPIID